jgi:acyl carrier protein
VEWEGLGADCMTLEDVIKCETGRQDVFSGTRLAELVTDSLEYVSLISAVENELGVKLGDLSEVETVGDLYHAIDVSARVC